MEEEKTDCPQRAPAPKPQRAILSKWRANAGKTALAFALLVGCAPSECPQVLEAAEPIQQLATEGTVEALQTQVDALNAAASTSDSVEVLGFAGVAVDLRDHILRGSQPQDDNPGFASTYHDEKMRLLQQFIDARREVTRLCE